MRQYRQGYIGSAQRLAASEIRAVSGECPRALSGQGAQRLAASEIRAVLRWAYMPPYDRCSTTDVENSTPSAQRLAASEIRAESPAASTARTAVVLNALRHQRSEQGRSARRSAGSPGAQRLAASEIRAGHFLEDEAEFSALCSTPCGIRDPSRPGVELFDRLSEVLNALRHQRSEQTRNSKLETRNHEVLNALRHQRSEQLHELVAPEPDLSVLNALRHQRSEQAPLITSVPHIGLPCSTPCGIRDPSS